LGVGFWTFQTPRILWEKTPHLCATSFLWHHTSVPSHICGEGVYPRWAAEQPPNLQFDFFRHTACCWQGLLRSPTGASPLATRARSTAADRLGCCAAQRGQAPSPQKAFTTKLLHRSVPAT